VKTLDGLSEGSEGVDAVRGQSFTELGNVWYGKIDNAVDDRGELALNVADEALGSGSKVAKDVTEDALLRSTESAHHSGKAGVEEVASNARNMSLDRVPEVGEESSKIGKSTATEDALKKRAEAGKETSDSLVDDGTNNAEEVDASSDGGSELGELSRGLSGQSEQLLLKEVDQRLSNGLTFLNERSDKLVCANIRGH